ncbi:MAG: hypothetical protein AAF661_03120 [Pseudomonadota bacterium]
MRIFLTILFMALTTPVAAASPLAPETAPRPTASPCAEWKSCRVGDRSYRYRLPKSWDGGSALPVLIHFHGADRNGLHVLRNRQVNSGPLDLGVVLVGADGRKIGRGKVTGRDWSWRADDLEDVRFTDAIVEDLAQRLPIDRSRIYLSGYSNGGGLVYRIACERGPKYAAYLPIAGRPLEMPPETCKAGPAQIFAVHGTTDAVFKFPAAWRRGEVLPSWRRLSSCAAKPDQTETWYVYTCRHWSSCAKGGGASLCQHRFGHILPKTFLPYALKRLLMKTAS